jgi:hypothetical protein
MNHEHGRGGEAGQARGKAVRKELLEHVAVPFAHGDKARTTYPAGERRDRAMSRASRALTSRSGFTI